MLRIPQPENVKKHLEVTGLLCPIHYPLLLIIMEILYFYFLRQIDCWVNYQGQEESKINGFINGARKKKALKLAK